MTAAAGSSGLSADVFLHIGAGLTGLMDPVEPGLACGSDTAHLSIFGYDPRRYSCARCWLSL